MKLPPILASLTRHRLTVLLLVLQVTFTFAIVCNVAFMIVQRDRLLQQPSGLAESELVTIESINLDENEKPLALEAADLAGLRNISGVKSAAAVDALPFNGNSWNNGIATTPDGPARVSATAFSGTQGELGVLGLRLSEGRDFLPDEYLPMDSAHDWDGINHVSATIVTKALAERLFPDQNAVGKFIYPGDNPVRIVGVVEHLLRPELGDVADNEYSMLFPMLPDTNAITYVMRIAPADSERVLRQASIVLSQLDGNRIVRHARTFSRLRDDYFQRDHTMIGLLLAAAAGLLLVTAVGIAGLASFWVQQRRRSIGIRRAVGATRGNILHYFQIENFLIVGAGVVLGSALAYAFNLLLMEYYELTRLPAWYLPVGALALWGLGQFAVLGPALQAAAVPPVVATRTV